MVGTIQGSVANKFISSTQSAQATLRGPNDQQKANGREEKVIRGFLQQENSGDKAADLPVDDFVSFLDSGPTIEDLKTENAELRRRLAAVEEPLNNAGTAGEDWGEQDREFARLLEEKTDVIRELHVGSPGTELEFAL